MCNIRFFVKEKSLACQIIYPFNKDRLFCKATYLILFKKQPSFLLNWEVISLTKELHGLAIEMLKLYISKLFNNMYS